MYYEWLCIAWMIIALFLGYQWYVRKNLKRAFIKPIFRLAYLLIPIAVFAALFVYINKPVQLPSHKRNPKPLMNAHGMENLEKPDAGFTSMIMVPPNRLQSINVTIHNSATTTAILNLLR